MVEELQPSKVGKFLSAIAVFLIKPDPVLFLSEVGDPVKVIFWVSWIIMELGRKVCHF